MVWFSLEQLLQMLRLLLLGRCLSERVQMDSWVEGYEIQTGKVWRFLLALTTALSCSRTQFPPILFFVHGLTLCLTWNFAAVTTAWIKGGDGTIWFLAIIYFISGVPCAFIAFSSSFVTLSFFLTCSAHFL